MTYNKINRAARRTAPKGPTTMTTYLDDPATALPPPTAPWQPAPATP